MRDKSLPASRDSKLAGASHILFSTHPFGVSSEMSDKDIPEVSAPAPTLTSDDIASSRKLRDAYNDLKKQLARVIVGQDDVIEELLIALFCRGHCILEGVPGLAKTLMISSLAKCLSLDFSRIQFTPDLMPSDITGTQVIEENVTTGAREFRFLSGPLFANMILA